MKRLDNMWVVIALFCSLLLTACTADNMDNPSVSPEEMPVVNDMMDTSVKPGDPSIWKLPKYVVSIMDSFPQKSYRCLTRI